MTPIVSSMRQVFAWTNPGVYGDIQHNIEGTFTVKKVGANYVYTFEGQGPYNLDCTALDGVLNLDWLSPLYTLPTEINTFDLQQTGNTWMQRSPAFAAVRGEGKSPVGKPASLRPSKHKDF